MYPIRGIRFKCWVCSDYDLCANCESFGKHNPTHPLLKMNRPIGALRPHDSNDLTGMHECNSNDSSSSGATNSGGNSYHTSQYNNNSNNNNNNNNNSSSTYGARRGGCRKWMRFANAMEKVFRRDDDQTTVSTTSNEGSCKYANKNNNKNKKGRLMAEFVKDVSLPDRSYYPTDTILEKTWEMKNTGTIEWGDGVELVFLKGDEILSLEKRYLVPNAKPQECVQISAMIRTPTTPGRYCAYFRLQKNGNKFGPRVWVDLFA
ncbi:hypothetical protein RFI_13856, partial [Reticulomyxa filosa]